MVFIEFSHHDDGFRIKCQVFDMDFVTLLLQPSSEVHFARSSICGRKLNNWIQTRLGSSSRVCCQDPLLRFKITMGGGPHQCQLTDAKMQLREVKWFCLVGRWQSSDQMPFSTLWPGFFPCATSMILRVSVAYILSEGLAFMTETSLGWASGGQVLSLTLLMIGYVTAVSQLLSVGCGHLQCFFPALEFWYLFTLQI